MRNIISAICLVGLVGLLLSCDPNASMVDQTAGGGNATVNVTMKATSHLRSNGSSAGRTMFDSIHFNQALFGVSWLHFISKDSTDNDSDSTEMEEPDSLDMDEPDSLDMDESAKVEGPFTFDLIAGTSTPGFDIAPGQYEGIVIKAAPILPDGNSIFIAFQATVGTDTSMVEFASTTPRAFGVRSDSTGFQFDGSANQVLVLLQLNALFDDIDFSKATADEDGVIRINKDSNKKLYNRINSNLGKAFKAGKDDDEDGDID